MATSRKTAVKKVNEAGRQRPMDPQPETIRASYRGSGKLEGKVALISGSFTGVYARTHG